MGFLYAESASRSDSGRDASIWRLIIGAGSGSSSRMKPFIVSRTSQETSVAPSPAGANRNAT